MQITYCIIVTRNVYTRDSFIVFVTKSVKTFKMEPIWTSITPNTFQVSSSSSLINVTFSTILSEWRRKEYYLA